MSKNLYSFPGLKVDVDAAIQMASAQTPKTGDPKAFAGFIPKPGDNDDPNFISGVNAVDEEYAATTTNRDPIIFVTGRYANGNHYNLLVDGSHRLFKAIYIDKADAIDYVVLSVEDTLKIAYGPLTQYMEARAKDKQ